MLRVVSAVVLGGLFCLVACSGKYEDGSDGSGGADGSDEPNNAPPPQRCREYASTWCTKFFTCYVQVGRMKEADKQKNITACYDNIDTRLPCADVQSISDDFDTCLKQVKGLSCAKFDVPQAQVPNIQPPASCEGAMSFD